MKHFRINGTNKIDRDINKLNDFFKFNFMLKKTLLNAYFS